MKRSGSCQVYFGYSAASARMERAGGVCCARVLEDRGGLRKPQLDGDLRRIRSGGDTGVCVYIAMI